MAEIKGAAVAGWSKSGNRTATRDVTQIRGTKTASEHRNRKAKKKVDRHSNQREDRVERQNKQGEQNLRRSQQVR